MAEPVSIRVEDFGTAVMDNQKIVDLIRKHFDMRPAAIIKELDLRKPIYKATASYGHFGRDEFSWEALDKVEALKKEF